MKKILIVDDEKSFLLSLKDGLSRHRDKFQILTAENGREAIDVLRSLSIDLLVTDLKLPEMNGFELLAWTSRHKPQLPVIVMSAFGTPEIEARLAKMDTLQFLEKPLDLEMLEEGISNGLNAGGKSFIRGITLATFLQLMKVEKKNCTLKVSVSAQSAYLYIQRGELIDAEYGALEGLEAALEIVGWDNAEIEMDGVCRRQNNIINMPMEHLLIDAFKRKDEAEELGKAALSSSPERREELSEPRPPSSPSEKVKSVNPVDVESQDIAGRLTKLASVQEYAIFDKKSSLRSKNPGICSLEDVDPVVFDHLLNSLGASLGFGDYNYIDFNSVNRSRYLLFQSQQYYILAKLKPGSRGQQIVEEIKRNMKQ
ncbi:MAG: response regulator [Thermodesulfobacteriota bacterium]|nr:response regulator [Thermodesulfobacteriota bacterium]